MATTTTYREMVNRVLSSCNQPEIPASQWDQAKLEARQVKRIVAECYRDMLNQMPDEHWHKSAEFTLRAPVDGGLVTDITGGTVTGNADFDAAVADAILNITPASDSYFRLTSENDWYRVESFAVGTITLENVHLNPGTWPDGVGYQLVQVRYDLSQPALGIPAEGFRDVVDVGMPLAGMDMEPTSVQSIRKMWAEKSSPHTAAQPRYYALGSIEKAELGADTEALRKIYFYPIVAEDIRAELIYQYMPTLLDCESGAHDDTLDLPEDMLDRLLYRAKMIARLEILGDAAGAGLYRSLEREKQRDDASKEGSQAGMNQLQPDVRSYREHYRSASRMWGGRLWRRS